MVLKIKKLNENAVLPEYKTVGAAGLDLVGITINTEIGQDGNLIIVYRTGLAVEIPEGYVGVLTPRSSIANKSLVLTNSIGIIDSDYRGEIMAKFKVNTNVVPAIYKEGEACAQLVIMPFEKVTLDLVEELSETERGTGGYGSTDKKPVEETN